MEAPRKGRFNMLPEHHHPHDSAWIMARMMRVHPSKRTAIASAYSTAYKAAYDAEPMDAKKDNAARFAANTRLRKYVERVTE